MSLDTVIKIGKLYRQAPQAWQYHDQVNEVKKDVDSLLKKKDRNGNTITTIFYSLPVISAHGHLNFDFNGLKEITDENKRNSLYYLNFKTSKKDAEKRYLFGDIVYSSFINRKEEKEENGNYRMGTATKNSSFFRCEEVAKTITVPIIQLFRDEFRKHVQEIEKLLTSSPSVVLHFAFENKRWLDQEDIIAAIDLSLTKELVSETGIANRVVLDKYLYKALGGVTPGFSDATRYKNRLFARDEIISLMYAGKAAEKPLIRINNIGILALPHSERLSALDVVAFLERNKEAFGDAQLDEEETKEEVINEQKDETNDSIFAAILDNNFDDKVKFDLVFTSIPGSPAGVFYDLIEIADVEKSLLLKVRKRIDTIKQILVSSFAIENPHISKKPYFDVKISFLKIFGDVTKEKRKFQFHILKVLPKIYSDTYFDDPILLPAFLEKVEYNIRNGGQPFNSFKFDFYFISQIQKTNTLMQITNSQSYALGLALGIMARPFAAWRDDCPIKSFEKSYVGNLTRRIASFEDLTKFADFLNEKLTLHEKAYKTEKEAFLNLVKTMADFKGEKYNKHFCSLGFFESYYSIPKKENNSSFENQQ